MPISVTGIVRCVAVGTLFAVAATARVAPDVWRLDRGNRPWLAAIPAGIGAHPQRSAGDRPAGALRKVRVFTSDQVRTAVARAEPGDVIVLAPGVYHFSGRNIDVSRPGTSSAPIVLRGEIPGSALLEFDLSEGFAVNAPYWTFADLSIRGACADHSACEHAFHVVGKGHHFSALNNVVTDFNAHFKINGSAGVFPDHGRIDGNTLSNQGARKTANPVTLIDLVAASDWLIRRNLVSDFIKRDGDHISYGAFAKGAGTRNVFEQNIIWCERLLRGLPGQRVGLSLGGGATGAPYCRDRRCLTEQDDSVIQSNLILACSDHGIYLNSAARSKILHNSLIDTDGVVARFATTSADVEGNVVDGAIRSRDGGILRAVDNLETRIAERYPRPPRRHAPAAAPPDLCGRTRPARPAYGAWEDLSACR